MPFWITNVTANEWEGKTENGRDPPLKEHLYTFKSRFHYTYFRVGAWMIMLLFLAWRLL